MRLSNAIALGRMLICPRRRGSTSAEANPGDGCVLDMAVVANSGKGDWREAYRIWPWLMKITDTSEPPSWMNTYYWSIIR